MTKPERTIPERSRYLVTTRDRHRCVRCGVPAPSGHWHHRRGRSVPGPHRHCACNGIWLCGTCHLWAHAQPTQAQEVGMIVARSVDEPAFIAVKTPLGWRLHDCDGGWAPSI